MSRAFLAISFAGLGALAALVSSAVQADEVSAPPNAPPAVADLFAAAKSGDLDVRFIPRDDAHARLILKNNTSRPVSVRLPEVFAASPVLAQQGFNPGGGFFGPQNGSNTSSRSNSGSAQTVGAGTASNGSTFGNGNGNNGNGFGNGFGNGVFSIPPEKTITVRLTTVCLEHGKPTPKPSMAYSIRPIDEVSKDPELYSVLKRLGEDDVDQRVVQAAAWHLANDMSWEKIAGIRNHHLNGISEPYFARREIDRAKKLYETVSKEVAAAKAKKPAVASMASASNR